MPKNHVRRFRELPSVRVTKTFLRSPGRWLADWRERQIERRPPLHELAIAAIFKNEALNLDEWLTFHAGVGVGHFYLYNNNSTDNYLEVLRPWVADGRVTLMEWSIVPGQRSAYKHCVRTRWRDARWIAFIDVDEFLFSPHQIDIRPIIRTYADAAALYVYWIIFGSSGHSIRPQAPVVEAFVHREAFGATYLGKSIVNPRYVRSVPTSHQFGLWRGETVDACRHVVTNKKREALSNLIQTYDILRINHYYFKSHEELKTKLARGDAFYGMRYGGAKLDSAFLKRNFNAERDTTILPVWRAILEQRRPTP